MVEVAEAGTARLQQPRARSPLPGRRATAFAWLRHPLKTPPLKEDTWPNAKNVRSSRSPDPPSETQGPSAGAPPLLHITLNTGRTTEHRDAELDPGLYALLQPLLEECGGAVPAMPGFAVAWAYCGDAVLIEIAHRAVHVAECGLAWGPQQASSLWEFLNAAASPKRPPAKASGNGTAPSMPRRPWMAEVLLPSISKRPVADAMLLGGFERCLGLAILRDRRRPN